MEVSIQHITSFNKQKDTVSIAQFECPNTSIKPCIIYKETMGYTGVISAGLLVSEFKVQCNDSVTYIDHQYVERTCLSLHHAMQRVDYVSPVVPNDSNVKIDNPYGISYRTYAVPDSILESAMFSTDEALISLVIRGLQSKILNEFVMKDSLDSKIKFLQKCINTGHKYKILFPDVQMLHTELVKYLPSEIVTEPDANVDNENGVLNITKQVEPIVQETQPPRRKYLWIF
jgi:hypothetical protein